MGVTALLEQVQLVRQVMESIMKEDVHFGKVPGTDKPTLYQAGAQKLGLVFRLSPFFEIRREDDAAHREYTVICTLKNAGNDLGQGLGSCSTMESKYRFRSDKSNFVPTGVTVPKAYWACKTYQDKKRALAQIMDDATTAFDVKKVEGVYQIVKLSSAGEKVENPNIADTYNTVLKMAKKRAYVDAVLNVTAASDVFSQDLEEIEENLEAVRSYEDEQTGYVGSQSTQDSRQSADTRTEDEVLGKKENELRRGASEAQQANETQPKGLNWRQVVIHIKTNMAPGTKLGQISEAQMQALEEFCQRKNLANGDARDKRFAAAVTFAMLEFKEKNKQPKQEVNTPQKQEKQEPKAKDPYPPMASEINAKKQEVPASGKIEKKPEDDKEEQQRQKTEEEIMQEEDAKITEEVRQKLRELLGEEGVTEEQFIEHAKRKGDVPNMPSIVNLRDVTEGNWLAYMVTKFDEAMIRYGERKPPKAAKK